MLTGPLTAFAVCVTAVKNGIYGGRRRASVAAAARSTRLQLKATTPIAVGDEATGALGGQVGFGNTAEHQFELILGTDDKPGAYAGPLAAGHSVQPLIMEVLGGFHPDMVRYIDGLARAHGARLGADELTAPWSARSFRALHVQRISVALQLAAAEEILDTILLDRSAAAMRGEATC